MTLQPITTQQAGKPVAETRNAFSRHAEELIRSRYSPEVADSGFVWPQTGVTRENFRDEEVIVSHIDGVVAGRAILDAAFHPIAELENLEVCPPFRGRGVGSAIVRYAIETASRAGFLAIHAQTEKDNVTAQRLYGRHGFMPATRGDMLRVWRFLAMPALSQFLHEHPMSLVNSRQVSDREHLLCWRDTGSEDELGVTIRGGSCQADSDGVGPSVSELRLTSGSTKLTARLDCNRPVEAEGAYESRIVLANEGTTDLVGGFRIGLNPGFRILFDHPGGEQFSVPPGRTMERSVVIGIKADSPSPRSACALTHPFQSVRTSSWGIIPSGWLHRCLSDSREVQEKGRNDWHLGTALSSRPGYVR